MYNILVYTVSYSKYFYSLTILCIKIFPPAEHVSVIQCPVLLCKNQNSPWLLLLHTDFDRFVPQNGKELDVSCVFLHRAFEGLQLHAVKITLCSFKFDPRIFHRCVGTWLQ